MEAPSTATHQSVTFKMHWLCICLLPVVSFLFSLLACIIAYNVGVDNGSFEPLPFIPYISDTGDISDTGNGNGNNPASSWFTFFLVLSCFPTAVIAFVRFLQLGQARRCTKANKVALAFAVIFLIGKIMAASFQLSKSKLVHMLGAGAYFLGATIYIVIHCYITKQDSSDNKWQKLVLVGRFILCAGLIVTLIILVIFANVKSLAVHNRGGANVAQVCEWLWAAFKMFYFLTFCYDFWKVEFMFSSKFVVGGRNGGDEQSTRSDRHDVTDAIRDGCQRNDANYIIFDSQNHSVEIKEL